ncbi:uncharacterized protein BDV17DRAFT_285481 [Aspergillus undulatus]|uniref:uncharacterized protein n=1 Tax=Aspergillus undulatus TaxID=1810928 RepID=UPI003CCC9708
MIGERDCVSWQRATVIFLKIQFAMSILDVPASLATLGALGAIVTAAGIVSISTVFNALSNHGACTVIFSFVGTIWLSWVGFTTFLIINFIFVILVTQQDRPPGAPSTGDFHLGWNLLAYPTFTAGTVASTDLFVFASVSSMYLPVVSEMNRPQDYRKAAIIAGMLTRILYITFSLRGPLFKKNSYSIALPGLVVGRDTYVHSGTWLSLNLILGVLGFINCRDGSSCFAPFSLVAKTKLNLTSLATSPSKIGLVVVIGRFIIVSGT